MKNGDVLTKNQPHTHILEFLFVSFVVLLSFSICFAIGHENAVNSVLSLEVFSSGPHIYITLSIYFIFRSVHLRFK